MANKNNLMDLYSAQIAKSTIDKKAELAAINEKANSYTNAYIKSLGLEGTSAGANAIANNNLNLMNSYAQVNENEQMALQNQENTLNNQLYDLYAAAVASGKTSGEINDIINNNATNESQASYYSQLLDASGINWESDRESAITNLEANLGSLSDAQKAYANDIIDKLKSAKSKEEYDAIYEKYKASIRNPQYISNSQEAKDYESTNIISNINKNSDYIKADIFENKGYANKRSIRQDRWNNGNESGASMPRSKEYDTIKQKVEAKYGKIKQGQAYYLDGVYYQFNHDFREGYYLTAYKKK